MAIKKSEDQVMILVLIAALRGALKTGNETIDKYIWRFITGLFTVTILYFVFNWFLWMVAWVMGDMYILTAIATEEAGPVIGWLGDGWQWFYDLFQATPNPVVTVPADPSGVITEVIPPID